MERTVKRQFKPVPDYRKGDPGVDPFKQALAREQRSREVLIAIEEIKLLAEKLEECYRENTVNHHIKCQHLAREYIRRISRPSLKDGPVELSDIE